MKPIPKTLTIEGHNVRVVELPVVVVGNHACDGSCEYNKNKIEILDNQELSRKWETLIHEVDHFLNPGKSEKLVELESARWYRFLVNNGFLK